MKSKLPFIYLPQVDLKILIDSGATNSVINPKPAFEKFHQFMYKNHLTFIVLETKFIQKII